LEKYLKWYREGGTTDMNKRKNNGQSTLELVLIMPVVLIFILVVSQFGHMVYIQNVLQQASREAARVAATSCNWNNARDSACRVCSGLNINNLQVDFIPDSSIDINIGDYVQVEISYVYGGIANIVQVISHRDIKLKAKSMMRLECLNKEVMFQ
jgi:uncharacterized protein (UPF0333 family)